MWLVDTAPTVRKGAPDIEARILAEAALWARRRTTDRLGWADTIRSNQLLDSVCASLEA